MAEDEFFFARGRNDLRLYAERAAQERAAAESASKPEAAAAHRLLANEYEARASALRADLAQDRRPIA